MLYELPSEAILEIRATSSLHLVAQKCPSNISVTILVTWQISGKTQKVQNDTYEN